MAVRKIMGEGSSHWLGLCPYTLRTKFRNKGRKA